MNNNGTINSGYGFDIEQIINYWSNDPDYGFKEYLNSKDKTEFEIRLGSIEASLRYLEELDLNDERNIKTLRYEQEKLLKNKRELVSEFNKIAADRHATSRILIEILNVFGEELFGALNWGPLLGRDNEELMVHLKILHIYKALYEYNKTDITEENYKKIQCEIDSYDRLCDQMQKRRKEVKDE